MKQKLEEIKTLAKRTNGIFRTADLKKLGFTAYEIRKMLEKHFIERIKHGYYNLSETDETADAEIIARLFPEGVLCMYTALFIMVILIVHRWPGISQSIKMFQNRVSKSITLVRPYYMEAHLLLFESNTTYGTDLKIFDKDRLICECVFFENKIDRETYNKAIQGYIADPNKNISNLLDYSKKRRILKKIKSRIGIWL